MPKMFVFLPEINLDSFLLFTWQGDGACLRDYSLNPDWPPYQDGSFSAADIRKMLKDSGSIEYPADQTRSVNEVSYWREQTQELNRQHNLPGSNNQDPSAERGRALRGSQYWIQEFVNQRSDELNRLISAKSESLACFGGTIQWMSPLASENYREYRDGFLDAVGCGAHSEKRRKFWPRTGPRWDALAKVTSPKNGQGVLLVEAKAYLNESYGGGFDGGPAAREIIERSFKTVKEFGGASDGSDWFGRVYQTANRLAFLYFLNNVCEVPTWLVLVNFVNDKTLRETSLAQWTEHYPRLWQELGLRPDSRLLDRVILVFPDVGQQPAG